MLISCIYCPLNTTASFFHNLSSSMDSLSAENKELHILGDFNIDLLNTTTSESKRLLCLMKNQGLHQMQNNPTRITENSSTLINHHYCTHPEHVLNISSPVLGLSDHNPTVLERKQNANLKSNKKSHFTITYRSLKKVDIKSLIKDLNEVLWSVLDTYGNDPDEMLST